MTFIRYFFFGSFFIALCAATLFTTYEIRFQNELSIFKFFFVFCSTLFSYNLVQIFPNSISKDHHLYRGQWIQENKSSLKAIMAMAFTLISILAFQLSMIQIIWLGHLFLLVVFYESSIFCRIGLRQVPYLKSLLISWVWCGSTSVLSFLETEKNLGIEELLIFSESFLLILSLAILFDIRDIKVDIKSGLKTIPNLIGLNKVKLLSICLYLSSLIINYSNFDQEIIYTTYTLIQLLIFMFLILKIKPNSNEYYFLGLTDGMIILYSCIVFI